MAVPGGFAWPPEAALGEVKPSSPSPALSFPSEPLAVVGVLGWLSALGAGLLPACTVLGGPGALCVSPGNDFIKFHKEKQQPVSAELRLLQ